LFIKNNLQYDRSSQISQEITFKKNPKIKKKKLN